MKNCYIYIRTASKTSKTIISNQVKDCFDYASANNYNVSKVFKDIGSSGVNLKRKKLLELLESCRQNPVDAIIILRLDNLSRNCHQFSLLRNELKKLNINLISVQEGDLSTPEGLFMGCILTAVNQFYSETQKNR